MPITLSVPEMTCEGCEDIIETAATEVPNVESAEADRHKGTVDVVGDPDVEELLQAMDFAGYEAEVVEEPPDSGAESDATDPESGETDSEAEDEAIEDDPDAEAAGAESESNPNADDDDDDDEEDQ